MYCVLQMLVHNYSSAESAVTSTRINNCDTLDNAFKFFELAFAKRFRAVSDKATIESAKYDSENGEATIKTIDDLYILQVLSDDNTDNGLCRINDWLDDWSK